MRHSTPRLGELRGETGWNTPGSANGILRRGWLNTKLGQRKTNSFWIWTNPGHPGGIPMRHSTPRLGEPRGETSWNTPGSATGILRRGWLNTKLDQRKTNSFWIWTSPDMAPINMNSSTASRTCVIYVAKIYDRTCLPVVPHTAVVEVSKIDNYSRRGEWLCCMDGAKPLMDRKLVGAVLFEMVAVVTSPTAAECSVVWCSVVECSGSCSRSWSVVYARVSAKICLSEQ